MMSQPDRFEVREKRNGAWCARSLEHDFQAAAARVRAARRAGRPAYVADTKGRELLAAQAEAHSRAQPSAAAAMLELAAGLFLIAGLVDLHANPARAGALLVAATVTGLLARRLGSSTA